MVKRGTEENISPKAEAEEQLEFEEDALDGLTSMEED
jgi:hypothetical protein